MKKFIVSAVAALVVSGAALGGYAHGSGSVEGNTISFLLSETSQGNVPCEGRCKL